MDPKDGKTLSGVAGPESMASPTRRLHPNSARGNQSTQYAQPSSSRDDDTTRHSQPVNGAAKKKKKHRAGRKRRTRRESFIAPSETGTTDLDDRDRRPSMLDAPRPDDARASFYRLQSGGRSNTSLESEALLDHRDPQPFRSRRQSINQSMYNARQGKPSRNTPHRPSNVGNLASSPIKFRMPRSRATSISEVEEEDPTDRTPLIGSQKRDRPATSRTGSGFGAFNRRRSSVVSQDSRKGKKQGAHKSSSDDDDYDVNNPPSVPGSPKLGSLDDVMIAEEFSHGRTPVRDHVIDIDSRDSSTERNFQSEPSSPLAGPNGDRRRTVQDIAEKDVCYPQDAEMSEMGEEDYPSRTGGRRSPRRRRQRRLPDLDVLDDWSREEKEERSIESVRAKKITEPVMVGGRLRPGKTVWHREEDDAPYRYTYFNETFDATIHSRTISELCQFGATFKDLFYPEAPELSDETDSEDEEEHGPSTLPTLGSKDEHRGRPSSTAPHEDKKSTDHSGSATPAQSHTPQPHPKRYGPRPTYWLDVLSPTEDEMKVLAKAFGIHQLTVEDILMQEPREKVELFQNYYFVNYRSFEQDKDSEEYMEPLNIYVVVFRDGVLSFHSSMTPHPANVRRRVRQLNDYMSPSADWVSYAVIDDVTDAYAPLVQQIEEEVDDIDDAILELHSSSDTKDEKARRAARRDSAKDSDKRSEKSVTLGESGGDMLRRIGECRKKVMSMYRLLGNKADVIKGFAKRCNEHWEVAPRSEIGLYLGDIQDHIVTMTGNLSHYENLLSRAHGNYLAQINIKMNERAEQTNDVLGKLTVLGTIVLPMNIVCGLWGMNVWVPGQGDEGNILWFWLITAGMFGFGLTCFFE